MSGEGWGVAGRLPITPKACMASWQRRAWNPQPVAAWSHPERMYGIKATPCINSPHASPTPTPSAYHSCSARISLRNAQYHVANGDISLALRANITTVLAPPIPHAPHRTHRNNYHSPSSAHFRYVRYLLFLAARFTALICAKVSFSPFSESILSHSSRVSAVDGCILARALPRE